MRRNVHGTERREPTYRRFKKSRRHRRTPLTFSHGAVATACIALGIVSFLIGIHVFLFRAIASQDSSLISMQQSSPKERIQRVTVTPLRDIDLELYTIRINTWQRLEQLLVSIEHHATCPGVAQIQVVWCEETGPPPQLVAHEKVVVERHTVNSLNERFHILEEAPTMGILSMDDDVLRPCEAIDSGFFKWARNPHRMVGFDARTHVVNDDGTWSYGYMSTTDKSNRYSISLPRYAFIHRDYFTSYMTSLPRPIFNHVAEIFNCEDISMSFWISRQTDGSPPLLADTWAMKSMVKLYSPERISGTKNHKKLRDECVESFAQQLELKGILQKSTIVHEKFPFFECGAKETNEPPTSWRLVDRNAELQKKLHHWKHMKPNKLMSELSNIRGPMMSHAYVLGLIADTTPWKKRWHKRRR